MSIIYTDKIHDIALNTFEITCYMFPLEDWELEDIGGEQEPSGVTKSVVAFDGAAEGGMVINPSDTLLDAIASNMLGVDEATQEDKEGALCEIANIICGNTVPLFAKDDNICVIRPPRIADKNEDLNTLFGGMVHEQIKVNLDEGCAEISIYYKAEA
tara:strand:+ start:174144 stop:174614 length:471 start_codon:yes stop_codon:yes gene_type:complete